MYLLSYVKIRGSVDWGKVWPIIEDLRYIKTKSTVTNNLLQYLYASAIIIVINIINNDCIQSFFD